MNTTQRLGSLVVPALVLCLLTSAAAAQEAARIVEDPPSLRAVAPQSKTLMALPAGDLEAVSQAAGETALSLDIVYTDGALWNPATRRNDKVRLRSYQGTDVDPDAPFVSPKIEATPGDTIRITLNNRLPADAKCTDAHANVNDPHCFNGTNLHTH
jgi:FtsP/CotA-like multicopper oxidase with cupredoxin domain